MRWFRRHNQSAEFAEAIGPELREMYVPEPAENLFDRIAASRQSGARVILPDVGAAHPASHTRIVVPAALIAALLLIVLPFRSSSPPANQGEATSLTRFAMEWISGSVALAQPDASRSSRNGTPLVFAHPERFTAKRIEYSKTWRDSSLKEIGHARGTLSVTPVVSGGVPSWLVVARNDGVRSGKPRLTVDTVVIARDNLRPLRHVAIEQPYSRYSQIRIDQVFSGDSISGSMHAKRPTTGDAVRSISRRVSEAHPFLIDGLGPVVLSAVDLHPGWRASASMIGWAVRDDDVVMHIDMNVERSETITVPAGKFDCWRLAIRFAGGSVTYWVRKSDGVGVRSVGSEPHGVTREVVLVKG